MIRGGEGTDTNFYYDDWGRMISKDQASYDATYEYRYGDKLYSVTSDFPGEGNVEYDYGSDGKRRTRETATSYMWYNWAGWNVINEEDSGNFLERTYIHDPGKVVGTIRAHSQGTNPSTGTWRYYLQDNIGSTRNLTDDSKVEKGDSKVEKGRYWYYPYGDIYSQSGEGIRYKFTGKEWDDDAQMYYFPFRYYSPGIARWMTRDPIGMAAGFNLYGYVGSNPANFTDPLGLIPQTCIDGFVNCIDAWVSSWICGNCLERCRGQQGRWPATIELASRGTVSCGPGPEWPEPEPAHCPAWSPAPDVHPVEIINAVAAAIVGAIALILLGPGSGGLLEQPALVPGVIGPPTPGGPSQYMA